MKLKLHEFASGSSRGLWLHGWLGSGKEGRQLQTELGDKVTLCCPDLPGHGGTPLNGWTLEHTLSAIADLASTCSWASGYSMGGRLLMRTAERYPDAFKTLIIESASLGICKAEDRAIRTGLDQQRGEKLREQGLKAFYQEWIQMEMWGGFSAFPEKEGDELELAGALELFSVGHQPDLRPWIQYTEAEILWIAGKRDPVYADQAEWINLNTSHEVTLIDAGHNVHLQKPEKWGKAVRSFLKLPS